MRLLAIDTATEACSAALMVGETMLSRYEEPGRGHAERILAMVDELLAEGRCTLASLDAIAVGRGPGAFTGVRIAVGVAQGLAFGADKPVVLISDLAALAQRAAAETQASLVVACIDARMSEVYWGHFASGADGLVSPVTPERVGSPATVELPNGAAWVAAGTGWAMPELAARRPAVGTPPSLPGLLPRATEVARLARRDFALGRAVPADQALPTYLRDDVARPKSRNPAS
jgi:tRNA threonylcarbamoyladenosine biosynthesis protein TsaB